MTTAEENNKPIEQWCAGDFINEAARILDVDWWNDQAWIGGMMLASIAHGCNEGVLRRFFGDLWRPRVLGPAWRLLRKNDVFQADGRVTGKAWLEDGGGLAFVADVGVAQGLLARSPK